MEAEITYNRYNPNSSQPSTKFFLLNIHSIRNKLHLLEAYPATLNWPQVVILTETWIEPLTQNFYNLRGYEPHHVTRPDGYGGLTVFVREHLRHTLLFSECRVEGEVQCLGIRLLDLETDLITVYRKPNERNLHSFLNELDTLL